MKLKPIFCLIASLSAPLAHGADLLSVYHAAQGQDPEFAAARASHSAGQEKLTQGRSLLLPSVNLTANSTFNNADIQYIGGGGGILASGVRRYNSHGYGVSLVQPLFRQQSWMAYSESAVQVDMADSQFRQAEQDMILRVAQAYFDVLMAQDNVQLAEAQKTAISEQLAQAKRNFEVGTATITDTHEAQARYDLVNAQLIAAQSTLSIKKESLKRLTNASAEDLRPLSQEIKLEEPAPNDIGKWIDDANHSNPQLAMARANLELSEKEVARNFGGHLPTVDLVASYNQNKANGGTFGVGSDQRITMVGVQLNMPLFNGGATHSKYREAAANRDKAREDLTNAQRTLEVQTQQAYLGVVNGIAQVTALQQARTSSESLLEASKLGQEVGVRTNLDVLNAQQQMYATRRDLLQAEYNYLISKLRLKAAAGTLSEADLQEVNQALY
jgi:outer membrane protein